MIVAQVKSEISRRNPPLSCCTFINITLFLAMYGRQYRPNVRMQQAIGPTMSRSTIGRGGRGCKKLVPVLRGDGTKIASSGDLFDQLPSEMN